MAMLPDLKPRHIIVLLKILISKVVESNSGGPINPIPCLNDSGLWWKLWPKNEYDEPGSQIGSQPICTFQNALVQVLSS